MLKNQKNILQKIKDTDYLKMLMNVVKFILKTIKWIIYSILFFIIFNIVLTLFFVAKYSDLTIMDNKDIDQSNTELILTPEEYHRTADQTYLTFPEWFLVFAPQSLADFLNSDQPDNIISDYPLWADIAWLWQSYYHIYKYIKDDFEFNWGYHLMNMVIWVSSTIEYNWKVVYEWTIWKLTKHFSWESEEDQLYATFAKDYVDFLYLTPWYKFPFGSYNEKLSEIPEWENSFRSKERKMIMWLEFAFKQKYAQVIWDGTKEVFDAPEQTTSVVIDRLLPESVEWVEYMQMIEIETDVLVVDEEVTEERSEEITKEFSEEVSEKLDEERTEENTIDADQKQQEVNKKKYLYTLPRYQGFTDASIELAKQWVNFSEIAWNNQHIMISLFVTWGRYEFSPEELEKRIFIQEIVTKDSLKRVVVDVPIKNYWDYLRYIEGTDSIEIEHVFDF